MTETQTTRDVPNADDTKRLNWLEKNKIGVDHWDFNDQWEIKGSGGIFEQARTIREVIDLAMRAQGSEVLTQNTPTAAQETKEVTPTATSRKPESGAPGCGGAEEAKTDEDFEKAARELEALLINMRWDRGYGAGLVMRNALAALRQKSASKELKAK